MAYDPIRARPFKDYKEAQECYERAKEIAETIRGDRLSPGELSAMYEGFMSNLREESGRDDTSRESLRGWQTEWELLAEAARAAMDGKAVVAGKVEPVRKSLRKRSGADSVPE